mmetsp:Transcript_14296/g.18534  ORF Transcript_14296/g.18534 Transcript_14296/m.18534 type:complete len:672 (-) Transcript_14296:169-2184(-)
MHTLEFKIGLLNVAVGDIENKLLERYVVVMAGKTVLDDVKQNCVKLANLFSTIELYDTRDALNDGFAASIREDRSSLLHEILEVFKDDDFESYIEGVGLSEERAHVIDFLEKEEITPKHAGKKFRSLEKKYLKPIFEHVADDVDLDFATLKAEDTKIGKLFGTGSFGNSFTGEFNGETVILKNIREYQNLSYQSRRELQVEGLFISQTKSKYLANFLGTFVSDNELFVVTQAYPISLYGKIFDTEGEELENFQIVKYSRDILEAVSFLHSKGLVHHNVNTKNIYIQPDGSGVVLADFGLQQSKTESLRRQHKLFSRFDMTYWSPETLKNKSYTYASDVYSFAVVLWEMLEKKKAFEHMNLNEILQVISNKEHPRRPKISKGIPSFFRKSITLAWQQSPQSRPTARVLCDQFKKQLNKNTMQRFSFKRFLGSDVANELDLGEEPEEEDDNEVDGESEEDDNPFASKSVDELLVLLNDEDKGNVRHAAAALCNIAVNKPRDRRKIAEAKSLDAVLQVLAEKKDDVKLIFEVFQIIRIVASGVSKINRERLVNMGAHTDILRIMEHHSNNSKLQELGLKALSEIAASDKDMRGKLIDAKTLSFVLDLMARKEENAKIQGISVSILYSLLGSDHKLEEGERETAIDLVSTAVENFSSDAMISWFGPYVMERLEAS